jgi:hypothetical protein
MSMRGLLVALLCGVLGIGGGIGVARLAQPGTSQAGQAHPIAAVSPSVPSDEPVVKSYAPNIDYPTLERDLPLPPPDHLIGNQLATWHYRIPAGWVAYAACTPSNVCPPHVVTDTPLTARQAARQSQVRFRPAGEPPVGGYSLRVEALDNTLDLNPGQMVSTKIAAFRQAYQGFRKLKQTDSAVYFTYRDGNNRLRYNFFQWFAASGSTTATLEMSVAGRAQDAPGLRTLFNRFALIVSGTTEPYLPGKAAG